MARYLWILFALVAVLGLVACDSKKDAGAEKKPEAAKEEGKKTEEGAAPEAGAATEEAAPEAAAPEAGAGEAAPEAAAPAAGGHKEGDSCEGQVDAASALMDCDGQKVIFCSSYTKYVWTMTQECAPEQKCKIADDQKSGGCE